MSLFATATTADVIYAAGHGLLCLTSAVKTVRLMGDLITGATHPSILRPIGSIVSDPKDGPNQCLRNSLDLADQIAVSHPDIEGLTEIAYVMFRDRAADGEVLTCTTLKPGRVDRSPCGTGSSANLACLHARGEVAVGDRRVSRSTIGGRFTAEVLGETRVGPYAAILPRITGRAWIYGFETLRLSPDDPFATGFALSDSWGPQVKDLL